MYDEMIESGTYISFVAIAVFRYADAGDRQQALIKLDGDDEKCMLVSTRQSPSDDAE